MSDLGYSDTPIIPGSNWHVHDGDRPQPRIVDPAYSCGNAPSDAVILFDGSALDGWQSARAEGGDAGWKVEDGHMEVVPAPGRELEAPSARGERPPVAAAYVVLACRNTAGSFCLGLPDCKRF